MTNLAPIPSPTRQILVVDQAPRTRRRLALQLESAGYAVLTAPQDQEAAALIRRHGLPRLLLLEQRLQGLYDVIATLPTAAQTAVIWMAAAEDAVTLPETVAAVTAGRLVKPIVYPELIGTVRQALAHIEGPHLPVGEVRLTADVRVDFANQTLTVDGRVVVMTPTETRLLQVLFAHRGRVVSPGHLMSQAWRDEQRGTLGTLWVHIRRLRNKLERDPAAPETLVTVRGQGYCLQSESTSC